MRKTILWVGLCFLFQSGLSLFAADDPFVRYPDYERGRPLDLKSGLGEDHAFLGEFQSRPTREYTHKLFYEANGQLSLLKVKALLKRLHVEHERVKKDMKESTFLEEVEVDVYSPEKAQRRAELQRRGAHKIIHIYTKYLIPTIERLLELVESGRHPELWDGLVDDFLRGHQVFFSPNNTTTPWIHNTDLGKVVKGTVVSKKFSKNHKGDEAINLLVEEENIEAIRKCLGKRIKLHYYLIHSDIEALKSCRFDLSRVNPGVSPMWETRTPEEIATYRQGFPNDFPNQKSKIYFKEVMLTGAGSPKLKAVALVNGERREFKVKWGREAHADIAASHLFYHLGFNVDEMEYRDEVKVYLGKYSYQKFISALQAKYGQAAAISYITSHGGELGDEWITIKDVALEARPVTEERAMAFDASAMDLNFRREFNGRMLLYALINVVDGTPINMKYILADSKKKHGEDKRSRILLRYQDLGYSFGTNFYINNPRNLLMAIAAKYVPNEFIEKGVVTTNKKKDTVKIKWSDFSFQKGQYQFATYYDLKWMARKIAQLKAEDIEWCLSNSGMPREVAKFFRHKLVSRRNEIIRSFELEKEVSYDFEAEQIAKLSQWTSTPEVPGDAPAIVNGKLVKGHFDGKKVFLINQQTILYNLIHLVSSQIGRLTSLISSMEGRSEKTLFAPSTHGIMGLATNLGLVQTFDSPSQNAPLKLSLGVGISATIARDVVTSPHDVHSDHDHLARPWLVKDVIVISIGASSPFSKQVTAQFSVGAQAAFKIFEARFEFDHYAESYGGGYKSSFLPFLRSLAQSFEESADGLNRLEVLRRTYSIGFQAGYSMHAFDFEPIVSNQLSLLGGVVKLVDFTVTRDQNGELHFYSQDSKEGYAGADVTLLHFVNPILSRLMGAGYKNTKMVFKTEQEDLRLPRADGVYSHDSPVLSSGEVNPEELKRAFKITGSGTVSFNEKFVLLHGRASKKVHSQTKVEYADGNQKKLNLHLTSRDRYFGISSENSAIPQRDLTVKNARRTYINIEMDEYDPKGFTVVIKSKDYFRVGKRKDVVKMIDRLNRRFSRSAEQPFFENYELPPVEEVDDYRKIYGFVRIYVSGHQLLEKIEELAPAEFESRVHRYFVEGEKLEQETSKLKRAFKGIRVKHFDAKLRKYFGLLQTEARRLERNHKAIFPLLDKLIYHLEINRYGAGFLKELLGEENLLVMGEIQGVFPSFSAANVLQERQKRRFVGTHWGELNLVPPLQRHNRYGRVLYPSMVVPNQVSPDTLFGPIVNGYQSEL